MHIGFLLTLLTILLQSGGITVPTPYEHIVPRIYYPVGTLLKNLRYEGNNIEMRGQKDASGNYIGGEIVAARWRSAATNCKSIFVLRDSLYSQQDHPYRQTPYSLLLPPNWVASAAFLSDQNKTIILPTVFPVDDDAKWGTIQTPQDLFGSFPISESLFKRVIKKSDRLAQTTNARLTMIQLHHYAKQLALASKEGAKHVLQVGAELICKSDCNYFGYSIRRNYIIPIFVENPNAKEETEGKGTAPAHLNIAPNFIFKCTKAIYKRRLEDGDIAIERYDLSNAVDCARATSLVEALVPEGEQGTTKIWIWVTGPLHAKGKLTGKDAMPWVEKFKLRLEAANVNLQRIKLFSKPSVSLPSGATRSSVFNTQLRAFRDANMPMSINLSTKAIQKLIEMTK